MANRRRFNPPMWRCDNCKFINFFNRTVCYNCATKRVLTNVTEQMVIWES